MLVHQHREDLSRLHHRCDDLNLEAWQSSFIIADETEERPSKIPPRKDRNARQC